MEISRVPVTLSPHPSYFATVSSSSSQTTTTQKRVLQDTSGNIQNVALDSLKADNNKSRSELDSDCLQYRSQPQRTSRQVAIAGRLESRKNRREASGRNDKSGFKYDVVPYQQYRARQKRDHVNDDNRVWPDDVEEAFKEALEIFGRLGRGQVSATGKLHGKNELIAEYIFRKTGKQRTRKQVSSHIQVLKVHMKDSPQFLKLVTPKKPSNNPEDGPLISNKMLQLFVEGLLPENPHPGFLKARGPPLSHTAPPDNESLTASFRNLNHTVVRPVDFAMWVRPPTSSSHSPNPCTPSDMQYLTVLTESPDLPPLPLESVHQSRHMLPHLSSLHHARAVDCEVTLLETSLNMSAASSLLTGSVVHTHFEVLASSAYVGHTWQCKTNTFCFGKSIFSTANDVQHADAGYGDDSVKLQLPFASDFWTQTIIQLGEEHARRSDFGDESAAEELARRHVRNMFAMVELFATPALPNGEALPGAVPKPVALFLWLFSTTKPGVAEGKTTCRTLLPPPSRILTNSPAPPIPNASSLQSTLGLWEDVQVDDLGTPLIMQDSFLEQRQVAPEPLEENWEEVFPTDSATVSFPSSLESGILQENSQDSFFRFDSFIQENDATTQDPCNTVAGAWSLAPEEDTPCHWQVFPLHPPGAADIPPAHSFVSEITGEVAAMTCSSHSFGQHL